jgi:hypothetical protein
MQDFEHRQLYEENKDKGTGLQGYEQQRELVDLRERDLEDSDKQTVALMNDLAAAKAGRARTQAERVENLGKIARLSEVDWDFTADENV